MTDRPDYLVTDRYGDLDIRPLAALIATELGAEMLPERMPDDPTPWYAEMRLGTIRLTLYRQRDFRFRAKASVDDDDRQLVSSLRLPEGPDATFAASRPVAALAKDIERRVVEPSRPMVEAGHAKLAEERNRRSGLRSFVEQLKAQLPMADIQLSSDGSAAKFYLNRNGAYLYGDIYGDGSMSVQRCGTIPASRIQAVVKALTEEGE